MEEELLIKNNKQQPKKDTPELNRKHYSNRNNRTNSPLIEVLATHKNPGTDEMSAFRVLELTKGNGVLRIARNLRFKFITVSNCQIGEVPSNALLVGVGGEKHWADEHGKELKDSSAFQLVLKKLNLLGSRSFRTLESRITREDRYGAEGVRNHISQVVKDLYDMGHEFAEVYAWFCVFFDAVVETERNHPRDEKPTWFDMDINSCTRIVKKYHGEEEAGRWREFGIAAVKGMQAKFVEAQKALADKTQFRTIQTYLGEKVIFAPAEVQANPCVAKAARFHGADIVVVQSRFHESAVGTMLSVTAKSGLSLEKVVESLRQQELLFRGDLDANKATQLNGEGTLDLCQYWHALEMGQESKGQCHLVLSGTKTRPDGEKTTLPIEYIIDIVEEVLKEKPAPTEVVSYLTSSPPVNKKGQKPKRKLRPQHKPQPKSVSPMISLDKFLAPMSLDQVLGKK